MASYSDEILARIRDSVDIVELISQSVSLKKAGANYKGLCPFHEEKTPSFNVHPGKRIFHCFGCSRGGDIFKFLMLHQNLTFPETVKILAGKAGISLPAARRETTEDRAEERKNKEIRKVNAWAAEFYQDALRSKTGAGARKYLSERGISQDSVETFGMGFAPVGWRNLFENLTRRGARPEMIVSAGLAKPISGRDGYYDVFRDRILFPIHSPNGAVLGFGGRMMEEDSDAGGQDGAPKYLNSPDTAIFRKNRTLYGLHQSREAIRASRTALLVEGYFDVIALHQNGIRNVVASMGTALTPDHVRTLRREGLSEKILLCFDPDTAGEGAARRGGAMLLGEYQQTGLPGEWRAGDELTKLLGSAGGARGWNRMALQVVTLPPGEDADSFVRVHGEKAFNGLLENAENLIDYLLEGVVSSCPQGAPIEGRVRALEEAASFLSGQQEAVRREYVRKLSQRLEIDEDLAERILQSRGRRDERVQAAVEVKARTEALPPAEKMLVQLLLNQPDLADRLEISPARFSTPALAGIAAAVIEHRGSGEGDLVQSVVSSLQDPNEERLATELAMTPPFWEEEADRAALECLARIRRDGLKRRIQNWESKVSEAKRRGDDDEVLSLLREREDMRKEQAELHHQVKQIQGMTEASSTG